MRLLKNCALLGLFFTMVLSVFVVSAINMRHANAGELVRPIPVNPNPARVLNETRVRIAGRLYGQTTVEPIPNLVCTTTVLIDSNFASNTLPSTSCVRY